MKSLFLDVPIKKSVKSIHDMLAKNHLFVPRPVKTLTKSEVHYKYKYVGDIKEIYKNYDSLMFHLCPTESTDGTEEGHTIEVKLIYLEIFYSDTSKLNDVFQYIKTNRCRDIKFNTDVVYKYPIVEIEKHSHRAKLEILYVDKLR